MATVMDNERAIVIQADDDDVRAAIAAALARAGCTYEELAEQAATGDFQSTDAAMAWVAIGGLVTPAA